MRYAYNKQGVCQTALTMHKQTPYFYSATDLSVPENKAGIAPIAAIPTKV